MVSSEGATFSGQPVSVPDSLLERHPELRIVIDHLAKPPIGEDDVDVVHGPRMGQGQTVRVSGVRIDGNTAASDGAIVNAMKTKPEGFWWFRKGEFDEDEYVGDLGERIPGLFRRPLDDR